MKENVKKFLEEASKNEAMRKELQSSTDKAAMIEVAKAHGLKLTEDDFDLSAMNELSEDEMKAVAGGTDFCTCTDKGHGTEGDLSCVCNGSGEGVNITNGNFRCGCFSTLGAGMGLG